ncbi:MAG: 50S ribosomal protein L9 [Acidimicrobiales bacterium]
MQVLLRDDVAGLGRRGEVVEVAAGYARNFLLPTGVALRATSTMASQAASMRRSRDLRDARTRDAALVQKAALESSRVTITARAGATGRLFGSVTEADVVAALRAATGVTVERSAVHMAEHLKAVGPAEVTVALFGDVVATVGVEVVAVS